MIKRVYAKNYRSLAEIDVKLDKLTVLVGPNGAGKSNFVDVLRFLADAMKKGIEFAIDERQGIKAIRRWAPRRPYDIEIEIEFENRNQTGKYRIEIKSIKPERDKYVTFNIKRERAEVKNGNEMTEFEIVNGRWIKKPKIILPGFIKLKDQDVNREIVWPDPDVTKLMLPFLYPFFNIGAQLTDMNFYNIYPNDIKVPKSEPSTEYPLDSYGRNIASVLRRMQRDRNEWIVDIKESLGRIVPGIIDIEVKQISGFLTLKFWHEYGDHKKHDFDAYQESDGTLRVLGILVSLFQQPPPLLLAIEEPELTVHPGVLAILSDLIKEASEKRSQVIITTHSPDLISQFNATDLRVVEWNYQEGTTIAPVDETQIEVVNKKLFSCGDLLRIEGLRQKNIR